MIGASDIGPDGEVRFTRPPADQQFIEPIGSLFPDQRVGADTFPVAVVVGSPLAGQRRPQGREAAPLSTATNFDQGPCEPAAHRRAHAILPGSNVRWRFQVAAIAQMIDDQSSGCAGPCSGAFSRSVSGFLRLARCELYGLWRCGACARSGLYRSGAKTRVGQDFPSEIPPPTEEINQLLAHTRGSGRRGAPPMLASRHALKTPLTVITNPRRRARLILPTPVCREALIMRRQVDHHLARARALGRRASSQRAPRLGQP